MIYPYLCVLQLLSRTETNLNSLTKTLQKVARDSAIRLNTRDIKLGMHCYNLANTNRGYLHMLGKSEYVHLISVRINEGILLKLIGE